MTHPPGELLLISHECPGTKLFSHNSEYRPGSRTRPTTKSILIKGINQSIPAAKKKKKKSILFRCGFNEQQAGYTKESEFVPGALGK